MTRLVHAHTCGLGQPTAKKEDSAGKKEIKLRWMTKVDVLDNTEDGKRGETYKEERDNAWKVKNEVQMGMRIMVGGE